MNSSIISGAYGTLETHQGIDPLNIGNERVKAVHARSYKDYGEHAGNVATNTFQLTRRVFKEGQFDRGQDIIEGHVRLMREILSPQHHIVVSLGPWGDCYKPEEAPSLSEGADFWEQVFLTLLRVRGGMNTILAETINNGDEAEALAEAWKRVQSLNRQQTEFITSFIPSPHLDGKLYSGEDLAEVAKRMHSRFGRKAPVALNCFDIRNLQPALETLAEDSHVRIIYPNAADGDPKEHDGASTAVSGRNGEEVALLLTSIAQQFRDVHPNLILGECCGSDPSRIEAIAKSSKSRLEKTSLVA